MALIDFLTTLGPAAIAAISAITVALSSTYLGRVFSGRDRRRQMYGEAFRAALEWREMLYRVRRRDNTKEGDRELVQKFHELQEKIDYYEGWIGSESKYMRTSYRKLIKGVKKVVSPEIQKAWTKEGRSGNAEVKNTNPSVDEDVLDGFLSDVRNHLSVQPWRWICVVKRNGKR